MNNKMMILIASSLTVVMTGPAAAAVSEAEAARLGNELTRFGAERAGNADGSIPAYEGGLRGVPEGVTLPASDGLVDPFADDQPLFRITAENMHEYADNLSEGQKQLLQSQPGYYMDVYQSRRTAAYPEWVLENTVRNATQCQTIDGGLGVAVACRGGIPFPIPQTGNEVMWNMILAYAGDKGWENERVRSWSIDARGRQVLTSELNTYTEKPYYQLDLADRDVNMSNRVQAMFTGPARESGRGSGTNDYLNPNANARYAWSYTPGQRRVRRAPEFAYDTPNPASGGVMFFDEVFLFSGKQDRFDFELVGKQEMFIPYNVYRVTYGDACKGQAKLADGHVNPACERWELHRTWVVEATLKQGMRHAYSKRRYYWDEDALNAGLYEAYDQSGNLYRHGHNYHFQTYTHDIPSYNSSFVLYDFNRGGYYFQSDVTTTPRHHAAKTERELSPATFAGSGVR